MPQFTLDSKQRFVIEDYQAMRPFASFLPGIAGELGVPLWAFYVNRGQAIASFGIENKDAPILEFEPANKAYQNTPNKGFRTFLKLQRGAETQFYEPFRRTPMALQTMAIGMNDLELQETNPGLGIQIDVRYFTLPNESFAGLARQVTLRNTGETALEVAMLDGLPAVVPYGVNNLLLKELGRTVEAWMEVFNLEANIPFYCLRASVIDRNEVETYQAGHFALAFADPGPAGENGAGGALAALVDPAIVFGYDTTFALPERFIAHPLDDLLRTPQVTCGRTPCAFFARQAHLAPQQALTLYGLYGHVGGLEVLERHIPRLLRAAYIAEKSETAAQIAAELTDTVATRTSSTHFDAYCRQNFLDNVLRGGWPVQFNSHVYHIYSRKHGDLERDYNAFQIAPEPYSQGEASYRDVNQNRRDGAFFYPAAGDDDIRTFMSLIQSDGYNPRAVKGSLFTLSPEAQKEVLTLVHHPEKLQDQLAQPFTPGKLLRHIAEHNLALHVSPQAFLWQALHASEQHIEADFHEGYWIDHWEYNLDLIESYLAVYPDRQTDLFFDNADLPFFDSPMVVQPRVRRYVLANGRPRQLNSLLEDEEKTAQIAARKDRAIWMRTKDGNVYRASLFAKLCLTAVLKFATLDPWGMGIEMEAGRPGWDDALNGLPALFGSGMAETFELQRWLNFLRRAIAAAPAGQALRLPIEAAGLLADVTAHLENYHSNDDPQRDFTYWDQVATARESYRQRTRLHFDGAEQAIPLQELDRALAMFQQKVSAGIQRAIQQNDGLPPTYFTYTVDAYEVLPGHDAQGRPYIRATHFTPNVLPLFLEGPVKAYAIQADGHAARELYRRVKTSALFDQKLQMYKLNASLAELPHDIGRARAFPPGWLENESIWLHMAYKYLLAILDAGLYEEFFEEMPHALVPFFDPTIYGRSTLENSSFLASSAHPDPALHGAGFVARLSGSTAEFLSIWRLMMAGKRPFTVQNCELCLALRPALPGWLFDEAGEVAFRFLGHCTVTYHNPHRLDTYGSEARIHWMELHTRNGQSITITGDTITAPYASMVREGSVERIDAFL
ncbi:MAG: cellobiose phosphorylase [Chloroflexota bacterium]